MLVKLTRHRKRNTTLSHLHVESKTELNSQKQKVEWRQPGNGGRGRGEQMGRF